MFLVARWMDGRPTKMDPDICRKLPFIGLCGTFIYPVVYFIGIQSTTPTAACIMESTTPVFTLLIETFILRQQAPDIRRLLGSVIAGVGSASLIAYHAAGDTTLDMESSVFGNFMVLLSAVSYAVFLTAQREVLHPPKGIRGLNPATATAWGNMYGGGLTFLLAVGSGAVVPSELKELPVVFWGGVLYAALVTSVCGYIIEGYANFMTSAGLVSVYNASQPFGAAILSYIWGNYQPSFVDLIFAACVTTGVRMVSQTRSPKTDEKPMDSHEGMTLIRLAG